MFKVICHTVIKEGNSLTGDKGKTVSLVRRNTVGTGECLSVTVDSNLIAKNFSFDEEWEAETFYTKTVAEYKAKYN